MNKAGKKKVAVIGLKGLPAFGGAAAVGENIIENLKDDFDIYVYSSSSHTELKTGDYNGIRQIVFKQFPIKSLNTFYYYFIAMIHSLIIAKYNLIHLHHIDGGFVIPFLKIRYKVITTSHGRPQFNDKWSSSVQKYFALMEKVSLKFSDRVISVSEPIKKDYDDLGISKVKYIPNGISLNSNKEIKKKYDLSFAAGRIIPLKGLDTLLSALGSIKKKITTLIIGDTNQSKDYDEKLNKLSKDLPVLYAGLIKDKKKLFDEILSSKIFVFPSRYEAMSMMLLEVVSLKVPVICSDIEANKSIFDEDEVLFFEVDNSESLCSKINYALKNLEQMNRKAEKAYMKAKENYSWDKISNEYAKEYRELING